MKTIFLTSHFLRLGIIFFLFYSTFLNAQYTSQKYWYFGHYAGIHFGGGGPSYLNDANTNLLVDEAIVTQSDPSGNLLYYYDGERLYDRNHTIVSTALNGCASSTQAFTAPVPSVSNKYALFYVCASTSTNLHYSLIDEDVSNNISIGGGNMNIAVSLPSGVVAGEAITGIRGCADNHWIIFNDISTDKLHVAELDYLGNVTYNTFANSGLGLANNTSSFLKASPDGTSLAYLTEDGHLFVYDFDRPTGVISNKRELSDNVSAVTSPSFSPDSRLLYASRTKAGAKCDLLQFEVNNYCAHNTVEVLENIYPSNSMFHLQLGPDGKIYGATISQTKLFVINQPNERMINGNNACDYQPNGPALGNHSTASPSQSTVSKGRLPNVFDAYEAPSPYLRFTYSEERCLEVEFNPVFGCGAVSIDWDFGDGKTSSTLNPVHTYSKAGIYTVEARMTGFVYSQDIAVGLADITIDGLSTYCHGSTPAIQPYSCKYIEGVVYDWNVIGGTILHELDNEVVVQWTTSGAKRVEVNAVDTECTNCEYDVLLNITEDCSNITTNNCIDFCWTNANDEANYTMIGTTSPIYLRFTSELHDHTSFCADNIILDWYWDFGWPCMGSANFSHQQNPTVVYPDYQPGTVCANESVSCGSTGGGAEICLTITYQDVNTLQIGYLTSCKLAICPDVTPVNYLEDGCGEVPGLRLAPDAEETVEISNQTTVYPNPSSGELFIQGLEEGKRYQVMVYRLDGSKVKDVMLTAQSDHMRVDLQSLSSGVYQCKIIGNNQTWNHSIVLK